MSVTRARKARLSSPSAATASAPERKGQTPKPASSSAVTPSSWISASSSTYSTSGPASSAIGLPPLARRPNEKSDCRRKGDNDAGGVVFHADVELIEFSAPKTIVAARTLALPSEDSLARKK